MTLAQHALHVFKKDVRRLRWEISGLLLGAVFLVWLWTDSWSGELNGAPIPSPTRALTGPFVAAIWFLLIARLMHSEPLVGDRHFWLTRPYSRSAVLLSKGLFAAAFLLLPLLAAQTLAVSLSGLPLSPGALLVNQLAIAAIVCLPAMAVAAVTRNLWQYVTPTALGGLAAGIAWLVHNGTRDGPTPYIVGAVLLGSISLGLLLAQYRGRRTFRNASCYFAACAAVALLVAAFPRDLAWTTEAALDGPGTLRPASFGIGPPLSVTGDRIPSALPLPLIRSPDFVLPIEVSGADAGDLVLVSPTVTLRTATGALIELSTSVAQSGSSRSLMMTGTVLGPFARGFLPPSLIDEPVTLHVGFWVKRFDQLARAALPPDGSAVMLAEREQCRAIRSGLSTEQSLPLLMCRHALSAAPWREIVARLVPDRNVNSSPPMFSRPVIPTIDPIVEVRFRAPWLRAPSNVLPAVALSERTAFVRVTFDVENLRLADYATR